MSLSRPRIILAGRIFMVLFMVTLLLAALPDILGKQTSTPERVAALLAVAAISLAWSWFWLRAVGRGAGLGALLTLVAYVGLLFTASVTVAPAGAGLLTAGVIIAGALFPWRPGLAAVLAVSLLDLPVAGAKHLGVSTALQVFLNDVLVGCVVVAVRQGIVAYRELEGARGEIARLAVSEERLRFARDLHDLLGQSLAMVVLKSEVVARTLPSDADGALRREVREVAEIARHSLHEIREAVAGYRQATLEAELASAQWALTSTGIRAEFQTATGELPETIDSVLAWALREGITNVVKHSHARHCQVRLDRTVTVVRLRVIDDGVGVDTLVHGNGLRGIAERVALVGGEVLHVPDHSRGFHLEVAIPLAAGEPAPAIPVAK